MNMREVAVWLVCCSAGVLSGGGVVPCAAAQTAHRTTLSLDGEWDFEDSVQGDAMPKIFVHKAPVSGLAHSATPKFPDVDQYQSRELLSNLVKQGRL
jgi:hypothetical protein